ncbi:hypothetical protein [Paludibacterium paludis]|uniref:Uncharacterized protein n=1 Tax=Paludibacterium paludis TaxID=1225769 RepID=A0A918U7L8_9NEIS|nr:hypothetical protein [Paludibacterium paludis]GGY05185.1 hypothetical protein GCM10011289_04700 [Paludibacterium paludis]
MSHEIDRLLTELESRCGVEGCCELIDPQTHHTVGVPLSHSDCHELKALGEVFGVEAGQLASVILKAGMHDLHARLDDDLARMTRELRAVMVEAGVVVTNRRLRP